MTDKKGIATRFLHDLGEASPRLLDNLTEDVEYHLIAQLLNVGPFVGRASVGEQFVPMLAALFPNGLAMTIHNVTAEGDFVAVECSSHAELGAGRTYANRYHFLFEFAGDRIKKVKEYADTHYAKETLMPG